MPATALNMIDMVGIGPLHRRASRNLDSDGRPAKCLLAWVAGAAPHSHCLTVSSGPNLARAMPEAGGSYMFFCAKPYGPGMWGKLFYFLLIWQKLLQAPLVIASGAIGFSQYLTYLIPLTSLERKAISGALADRARNFALPEKSPPSEKFPSFFGRA